VSSNGTQANGSSSAPSISGDGTLVAYHSQADNLLGENTDLNSEVDIFLFDTQSATTIRLSKTSQGGEADGKSEYPFISADGRFAVYRSLAFNLVPEDINGATDMFITTVP